MIENLRNSFLELKAFFITLLVAWIAGGVVLAVYGYEESFLLFNRLHFTALDQAAMFFTHFADALVLISLVFLFTWHREKALPVTGIVVVIGTGIVVIVLKNFVFPHWDRPPKILIDHPEAVFLPASPPKHHAFPSGHATSFFGRRGIVCLVCAQMALGLTSWGGFIEHFFVLYPGYAWGAFLWGYLCRELFGEYFGVVVIRIDLSRIEPKI